MLISLRFCFLFDAFSVASCIFYKMLFSDVEAIFSGLLFLFDAVFYGMLYLCWILSSVGCCLLLDDAVFFLLNAAFF
jgi:hypothetical protein